MTNLRAKEAERAAQMFQKKREPELAESDDMFFDAKEFHTSNKQVANILSSSPNVNTENVMKPSHMQVNVENANWGEDDLDIDADNMLEEGNNNGDMDQITNEGTTLEDHADSDIFVPPS